MGTRAAPVMPAPKPGYLPLLSRFPRLLGFGMAAMLFCNFGQTFFISLFNGPMAAALSISQAELGRLYGGATLISGLSLIWLGTLVDRVATPAFTVVVCVVAGVAATLIAAATTPWVLGAGLLLMRITGQGLLSQTAVVTMSRRFTTDRGKALGLATLGLSLGEALLPLVAVALLGFVGWRGAWALVAAAFLIVAPPLLHWLARGDGQAGVFLRLDVDATGEVAGNDVAWTRRQVVVDPRFYLVLAWYLAPPFFLTGAFFYQGVLASEQGWRLATLASGFTAYAIAHVVGSIAVGPMVDHSGGRRLLWMFPAGLGLGFLLLPASDGVAVVWVYLALAGLTTGVSGPVVNATWSELYGTCHLGAIRALISALMVLATACAPVVFGWFIEAGVHLVTALGAGGLYLLIGSLVLWVAGRRLSRVPELA